MNASTTLEWTVWDNVLIHITSLDKFPLISSYIRNIQIFHTWSTWFSICLLHYKERSFGHRGSIMDSNKWYSKRATFGEYILFLSYPISAFPRTLWLFLQHGIDHDHVRTSLYCFSRFIDTVCLSILNSKASIAFDSDCLLLTHPVWLARNIPLRNSSTKYGGSLWSRECLVCINGLLRTLISLAFNLEYWQSQASNSVSSETLFFYRYARFKVVIYVYASSLPIFE